MPTDEQRFSNARPIDLYFLLEDFRRPFLFQGILDIYNNTVGGLLCYVGLEPEITFYIRSFIEEKQRYPTLVTFSAMIGEIEYRTSQAQILDIGFYKSLDENAAAVHPDKILINMFIPNDYKLLELWGRRTALQRYIRAVKEGEVRATTYQLLDIR